MRLITVAASTLNQTPLDWDGNQRRILQAIEQAKAQGVSLLCLPELCISGYGCEDSFYGSGAVSTSWEILQQLARHSAGIAVTFGLPVRHGAGLYNAVAFAAEGKVLGLVAKQHLANSGIHYEGRWFQRWPAGRRVGLRRDGVEWGFGDMCFELGGVRIGFEICEDAWVPARRGAQLVAQGIDIILNPSASHFAIGKHQTRRQIVLEGSRMLGATYLYSNLLGNEAGRAVYDGGAMVAQSGELLSEAPRFSYAEVQLAVATVDLDPARDLRARTPGFTDTSERTPVHEVHGPSWPEPSPAAHAQRVTPACSRELQSAFEEFTRAASLGLFDYLRKSGMKSFVLNLSGGADSAAVACLVHTMVELSLAELGPATLAQRLGLGTDVREHATVKQCLHSLLLCLYQGTGNSSQLTQRAAATLAAELGADFRTLDVQALVDGYVTLAAQALGRELSWDADDLALQNIQARVRAPSAWLLANLRGSLLLCTSNRSEAAVGYATMDGDTSGSMCPIAGVSKDFIRQWLRWMQSSGCSGCRPIAALALINEQAPTAELRPLSSGQADEQDLMPYNILDSIETLIVREHRTPREALILLQAQYQTYTDSELRSWLKRFLGLWSANQWKRERFAPTLHLDQSNLDPRSWCRQPILSGRYARELRLLDAECATESVRPNS